MDTWIRGGAIVTPGQTLSRKVIIIQEGIISAIVPESEVSASPEGVKVFDADGLSVTPGLIDVHVHGAAGHDTMDATPQALAEMAGFFLQHGVTAFLATTVTHSPEATDQAVANAGGWTSGPSGSHLLGVHLEGPYINPDHKGAQPERWVRNPYPQEYRRWFEAGIVRLVSLAPELPGALALIRAGTQRGIKFSAGHSGASYAQAILAADAGLDHATHTFNGMSALAHREPGVVGAVLTDDRIFCEIIADGIHIHPAVLRLVVRAKGVERTILVTDAMRATGMSDGAYDLGGDTVFVKGGVARTASGGLAGSTLTLDRAVANMMQFGGLTINQAVSMATTSPAASLGLEGQVGEIKPGAMADLLLVDHDFYIKTVFVHGEARFQSNG